MQRGNQKHYLRMSAPILSYLIHLVEFVCSTTRRSPILALTGHKVKLRTRKTCTCVSQTLSLQGDFFSSRRTALPYIQPAGALYGKASSKSKYMYGLFFCTGIAISEIFQLYHTLLLYSHEY